MPGLVGRNGVKGQKFNSKNSGIPSPNGLASITSRRSTRSPDKTDLVIGFLETEGNAYVAEVSSSLDPSRELCESKSMSHCNVEIVGQHIAETGNHCIPETKDHCPLGTECYKIADICDSGGLYDFELAKKSPEMRCSTSDTSTASDNVDLYLCSDVPHSGSSRSDLGESSLVEPLDLEGAGHRADLYNKDTESIVQSGLSDALEKTVVFRKEHNGVGSTEISFDDNSIKSKIVKCSSGSSNNLSYDNKCEHVLPSESEILCDKFLGREPNEKHKEPQKSRIGESCVGEISLDESSERCDLSEDVVSGTLSSALSENMKVTPESAAFTDCSAAFTDCSDRVNQKKIRVKKSHCRLENIDSSRQRSLEAESSEAVPCVDRSGTSTHFQRSQSYPQVSRRSIFLPIRLSPEQSGLFGLRAAETAKADTAKMAIAEKYKSNIATVDTDNRVIVSPVAQTVIDPCTKESIKQQPGLPVARVNPQTNPFSAQLKEHQTPSKNHQQTSYQVCSVSPEYITHDRYQQGMIPIIFVPTTPNGCYIIQDYSTGMDANVNPSWTTYQNNGILFPSQNSPCFSEISNYIPNHLIPEALRNPHKLNITNTVNDICKLDSTSTAVKKNSIQAQSNLRKEDTKLSHKDCSFQGRGHICHKRKHKKPLLPDPVIPKYSDTVPPSTSSNQSSFSLESYLENPISNFTQYCSPSPPVHQLKPESTSVNLQQDHFPSSIFSPEAVELPLSQPTSNSIYYPHNIFHSYIPDISNSSTDGNVFDETGFIIYNPSPQSRGSATSFILSSACGSISRPFPECLMQQQQQLSSSGLVYLPEASSTYLKLDSAKGSTQIEPAAYQGIGYSHEIPGPYLITNLLSIVDGPPNVTAEPPNPSVCPATVRMVSSNGPPVPMPMQVPPGHMVQQIVDEHGILTHVILSPQPPGPGGAMPVGPYGGPGSGSQYYNSYGTPNYGPGPHQYSHHPHSHPLPPGLPHINTPGPAPCANHMQNQGDYGVSPPLNPIDDRTMRTRNRVRKKPQRRINLNDGFYVNPPRQPLGGRRNRFMGMNGDMGMHGDHGLIHGHCPTQENGTLDMEEENSLIIQCLSSMPMPKVTDVESRSSLIQLSLPDYDLDIDLDPYDIKYELLLSDKGRDAKYKTVFRGDASEITLTDLKPATEYHLKVCAVLTEELKGALTDPVSFQTMPCEPDTPQAPKLMSKTKTSLFLKWNATCENGSKISAYCLESDQGQGDGRFYEIYAGLQRQFRVTRLNTSTRYTFRLMAINSLGKSAFSDEVSFFTSGSVPFQPDPPMLSEQFVYALTISWIRRPNDDEFLLQMEDEATGHGFITVYNGSNLSTQVRSLRRNTEYRFRLCTKNEEGQSTWSEIVCYRTLPERPQPPSKPQIKGKINPYSFRITWDPPQDTGGTEIMKYVVELDDGQGYDSVYEGSERDHLFDHLTPGHVYHVRVACCSAGGRSEFSDCCVATTLPVAPSQCQVPKLQGKPKATSLHLRWGYPDYDGGAQVMVFAAQMISPDNSAREVYKGHDRDCIVTGLLPGRPYLFQVRAFNRVGAGPWSEPLEIVSGAGVPDSPKAPHVLCRSAHSALVTWEEPLNNGANIIEYHLEWQQRSDTCEFSQLYVGPNHNFEVKGLIPATMYTFRVQAVNSSGPGSFSSSTSCVTPPSSPSAIISIRFKISATSLLLTWHEPSSNGSDITSYNIVVNEKPAITIEPVTEYLMEDLLPETTYKVRIQAVNSIGVGPYSSVVKCTTKGLPPSPPRMECVMLAPTSIKLKWGEGRNSDLLTYTLEMEKEDGNFQSIYTGPAHMHKVTRLLELTSYEFRIFASNEAGSGPYSDTYTFTTTKAAPPQLKAPKVRNLTPHSCLLEWQSMKSMGGDSVVYVAQLVCLNGKDVEFKQIYKGTSTQFQIESLQSNVEYQARVAAVRLSSDGTGEVIGVFSPSTTFSPLSPEPQRSGYSPSISREERSEEKKPWTDQQYAAVILCLFVLLAIVSAFLCQQLVSYMSGSEDSSSSSSLPSSASSSSPTSSSSSHNSGGGYS